jgi:hypothetical protein
MRRLLLLSLLALPACSGSSSPAAPAPVAPTPVPAPATARYEVVFDATWSASTHAVPANPHFSPLIGGTHRAGVHFWSPGALASDGIESMAERGSQAPLDAEVGAAIAAGTAQNLLRGGRPPSGSPGLDRLEFEVSQAFPLVSLVTMVAPSPDWFVGVDAVPLFENGAWVEERSFALAPWDAGTDSGRDFTSPDRETSPRQPIARIGAPPLGADGAAAPLGTFTFRRIG